MTRDLLYEALRARNTELLAAVRAALADRSAAYERRFLQLLQCEFKRDAEAKRAERAEADLATARTVTRLLLERWELSLVWRTSELVSNAERAWLTSVVSPAADTEER